ncbi:MAG: methionine ABC transporter substrate-binding protein [Desulfuromonadales bacterium]|nr:methionine ABC transporter substrate-binding protein [Desulfuromonadales bacterium]
MKLGRLKRLAVLFSLMIGWSLLAGCNAGKQPAGSPAGKNAGITLKIGAALTPHAEILNFIKPQLKSQGVNLEIVLIDEEGWMNPSLAEKQIDANYFQHVPYLRSVIHEKKYDFAVAAKVHIEPIGFYSRKIGSLDELKDGATIAIPNNPSNEYRTLALLEKKGLIRLRQGLKDFEATPRDIAENPRKLRFVEVESAQLVRALVDVDGALINTNYVLDARIDPASALFREDADSPYANVIVVRKPDENRPEILKLAKAATSPEVKKFIHDKYGVAVVPAF